MQTLKQNRTSHRALTDTYLESKSWELNEKHDYNPACSIYLRFPRISAKNCDFQYLKLNRKCMCYYHFKAYYLVNPVIVSFICAVSCCWCEIEIKQGNMYSGMKNQTLKEDITSLRALTDTYLVSKLRELNEEHTLAN